VRVAAFAAWGVLAGAAGVSAQVTLSAGAGWAGGHPVGSATATLRTNAPGPAPPPFTLFAVDMRMTPAPVGEARVGVAVTRRLTVEASAAFARRRLALAISGDPEAPAQALAGESVQHYQFDAGVVWHLPIRRAHRVMPLVTAGGGYLRQLHQDRTLVRTGQVYYAGGGARYWLRGGPDAARAVGLRGDLRVHVKRRGIEFEDRARMYPTLSLHLFVGL
jgi:hypothetical protein